GAPDVGPEPLPVRLEHGPLRGLIDRMLEEDEEAADVDVLPLRVRAHRPRTPDTAPPPLEEAERVDPFRVQHVLARLVYVDLEVGEAMHHLVGRRLVHAALDVAPSVDPGDEAGRREIELARRSALGGPLEWVESRDPGVVERGVLAVEAAAELADL